MSDAAPIEQRAVKPDSTFYDDYVERCSASFSEDRLRKVVQCLPESADKGLDVGCGSGRNLRLLRERYPSASLIGLDVAEVAARVVRQLGFEAQAVDASEQIPFPDNSFDFVLCGEVIEHVVKTDNLLLEIRRVLRPTGVLVLTTPNLAYLPNRLLLLSGIQPLFTETSEFTNMGRKSRVFGQGGATQGHLKVFTLPALRDIMAATGWDVQRVLGYRFFQTGPMSAVDRLIAAVPSFAAGFVIQAIPKA